MKTLYLIVSLFTAISVAGCAGNRDLIAKTSVSERQDVFQEASRIIQGKALLKVEFSVKANKARLFDTYFRHTDPPYTAVLNIDGQSVELTDSPKMEDLPGTFRDNPEAGEGWRYNFKKSLVLQPGKHRITVAVPVSDVIAEKELDLKEGENVLHINPIYIASITRYPKVPKFTNGLRGVTLTLNNQVL